MSSSTAPLPQHRPAQTASPTSAQPTAQEPAEAPAPAPQPKEWHEDDFVLALAHLEHIQDVVSSLRTTIPQLVRALTRKHESPQDLYADFSKEAMTGSQKIADLKKLWSGADMRNVRVKVEGSVREYGRSIEGVPRECVEGVREAVVEMPRYGWIEEGEELRRNKSKMDDEGGKKVSDAQQVEKIVEEFRKRHDHVIVEIAPETNNISVDVTSTDDEVLHFDISPQTEDGKTRYQVNGPRISDSASMGQRKLYQAMQRCISNRHKASNLEHTLEMLAAYKNLGEARCDVCNKIVDGEMILPAARRHKRVKTDTVEEVKWVAVHGSCSVSGM